MEMHRCCYCGDLADEQVDDQFYCSEHVWLARCV
jgi:hypothetical protein